MQASTRTSAILLGIALMMAGLVGCTTYSGMSFSEDGRRAYITARQVIANKVVMCDVGSDGMLSGCETAR